jgi:hypothetical protein
MQDYLKWACSYFCSDLICHNMKVYDAIKDTCCGYEGEGLNFYYNILNMQCIDARWNH